MAIKIYREEKSKELKTPMIAISNQYVSFASKEGNHIANYIFLPNGKKESSCKELLESLGYRTDFAEWDDEGRLVRFLEEIV